MPDGLDNIKQSANSLLKKIKNWQADSSSSMDKAEQFRVTFLASKGLLKETFELIKKLDAKDKKEGGLLLNNLKKQVELAYAQYKTAPKKTSTASKVAKDYTLPGINFTMGNRHPISQTMDEVIRSFSHLGYMVKEAGEVEDDWHNFTALNMPKWHPARDMQDTFYVKDDESFLLRTHTSNVQVRTMLDENPPIRMIAPGRVYRNETISARSHCFFHQVEGMYIDKKVSFADLKNNLYAFVRAFFGQDAKVRFRPSYFPFTTPSAEMDVSCFICNQEGCSICKHSGWVEILGCGMMHPALFEHCNIDNSQYTGFAFGMGIERLTMLKYQINDIRKFVENDLNFLSQFKPF